MIDKKKMLNGLTDIMDNNMKYNIRDDVHMWAAILFEIAAGNWDTYTPFVYTNVTCQDCIYLNWDNKHGQICAYKRRESNTIICEQFKMKGVAKVATSCEDCGHHFDGECKADPDAVNGVCCNWSPLPSKCCENCSHAMGQAPIPMCDRDMDLTGRYAVGIPRFNALKYCGRYERKHND